MDYLWKYRNADGLLERLPSWVFVEWSRANELVQDVNYPSNMTWADTLGAMDRLYERPDLAAEAARPTDVDLAFCGVTLPVPGGEIVYDWTVKGGRREETFAAPPGWRLIHCHAKEPECSRPSFVMRFGGASSGGGGFSALLVIYCAFP